MTLRLVKSMVWLQWRLLVNGLRGGRKRDSLERFSRWSQATLPAVATVLLIPAVLGMAAAGGLAGWTLATNPGSQGVTLVLTIGFLMPLMWFLLRPLALAGQAGFERGELLRLLPIPISFLRRLELFRAVLDPIFLLFAAVALALPLGTLITGRLLLTLVAMLAGALLLAFLACFSAVLSLGMQVLLRDRRRGEAATLVIFMVLSAAGLVPQLFVRGHRSVGAPASRTAPDPSPRPLSRAGEGEKRKAEGLDAEIPVALRVLPSGLYASGLADGSAGRGGGAAMNLGVLAVLAALAYAGAAALHRRLLDTPGTSGPRVSRTPMRVQMSRWPGFSSLASATATAQIRTVLRTVRGKMLLISPVFTTVLFALVFGRGAATPARFLAQPVAVAAIAVFIGLANLSSVTCNQFAADGSGLVLQFLQPVSERDLLIGKLAASTLLFAVSLAFALVPLAIIFPGVSPALLLAVLVGGLASHLILAPVNALLATVFPKSVDLGKLGNAGKPHGTAALLSFVAQGFAVLPAAGCIAIAWLVLQNIALAPLFTGVLAIAAWGFALSAMPIVARALRARRENLALVALGR